MRHASYVAAALATLLFAGHAHARCAPLSVRDEAARSDLIVEAMFVGMDEGRYRFRTIASWKGTPDGELVVSRGGRGVLATEGDVGTTYLLFVSSGDQGGHFVNRCGSSGRLTQAATTVETLRELGLERRTVR